MPKEARLPLPWAALEGKVHYVQEVVRGYEWSCTCPRCGGDVHPDGEWPDRCRLWVDGDKARLWCRRCGMRAFADQFGEGRIPTIEESLEWNRRQQAKEDARRRSAERALANLRAEEAWLRWHKEMGEPEKDAWLARGVPLSWQAFWRLGYQHQKPLGSELTSDTLTIPVFGNDWKLLNVKHRILEPNGTGKYRYEISGQGSPLFLTDPNYPLQGKVIVIEGEIKAMVLCATLADQSLRIVGLPGKSPSSDAVKGLLSADEVLYIADPGASDDMTKLAASMPKVPARLIESPLKLDDAIVDGVLSAGDVRELLRHAMPV